MAVVAILGFVIKRRVRRDHGVLRRHVHVVVDAPVDVAHLARRVKQTLWAQPTSNVKRVHRTSERPPHKVILQVIHTTKLSLKVFMIHIYW